MFRILTVSALALLAASAVGAQTTDDTETDSEAVETEATTGGATEEAETPTEETEAPTEEEASEESAETDPAEEAETAPEDGSAEPETTTTTTTVEIEPVEEDATTEAAEPTETVEAEAAETTEQVEAVETETVEAEPMQDAPFADVTLEYGRNYLASTLIGQRVHAIDEDIAPDATYPAGSIADWDDIGEIGDLVIGVDGSLEAVVIDVGGFLGLGEREVAIRWDALRGVREDDDPSEYFLGVTMPEDAMESAPELERAPAPGE